MKLKKSKNRTLETVFIEDSLEKYINSPFFKTDTYEEGFKDGIKRVFHVIDCFARNNLLLGDQCTLLVEAILTAHKKEIDRS